MSSDKLIGWLFSGTSLLSNLNSSFVATYGIKRYARFLNSRAFGFLAPIIE